MTEETPTPYCINHPDRPTLLRCNRCEQPVCSKCVVMTPTGYRCKTCVQGQQKIFETAQRSDYLLGFFGVLILSSIACLLPIFLGFWALFLAPIASSIIVRAAQWLTGRRRAPNLFLTLAIANVLGGVPVLLVSVLATLWVVFSEGAGALITLLPEVVMVVIFLILTTSTLYYGLRGIQLK